MHNSKIFDFVLNKNQSKHITENELTKFLVYYYNQSKKLIYNINYGFDTQNTNVICIPFSRKDTPIRGSNFSSLLLRLILTFNIYIINFDLKLQDSDYTRIHNDIELLYNFYDINELLDNFIFKVQEEEKVYFTEINIKRLFTTIYEQATENDKKRILISYLFNINHQILQYTSKQYNLSFQDIIYNNYNQWQVGYTGTVNMTLNTYPTDDKCVFRTIIPDKVLVQ